jgi:hypothetical protein
MRCGPCKKLNPNYIERPPPKISERVRFKPPPGIEVIEIGESPGIPPGQRNPPGQDIPPTQRRGATAQRHGLATQIPSLPDFKLGYAEKERQHTEQRIADRKTKTGFIAHIPTVHFSLGVAHFVWDEFSEDQGY